MSEERSAKYWIMKLGDSDVDVRRVAAEALGRIGDALAVDHLIRALGDEEEYVQMAAAQSLGRIGDSCVVEPLIKALDDWNWRVRGAAAAALGQLDDPCVVEPLIRTLGDVHWYVRCAAADALVELGGPFVEHRLTQALGDMDGDIRRMARQALSHFRRPSVDSLIQDIGNRHAVVRRAAAEALGRLGDKRAVDALIEKLSDKDLEVRQTVAKALEDLGEHLGILVLRMLSGEIGALEELVRSKDARLVGPLIRMLNDGNPEVRRAVAQALGQLGYTSSVASLIKMLDDGNPEIRRAVAQALGQLGDTSSVASLIKTLDDGNAEVSKAAAQALVNIGHPSVKPMIVALGHKDARVRKALAGALGRIGHRSAMSALIERIGDKNLEVRKAAAKALEDLGEHLGTLILEAVGGNRHALEVLTKSKDTRAVEPFKSILEHGDQDVRNAAGAALNALWRVLRDRMPLFLCPTDFTRFEKKIMDFEIGPLSFRSRISYAGCRVCGRAWPLKEVREVVVVLDREAKEEQVEAGGVFRVNLLLRKDLFDFDRVEIGAVKDKEVEQFVIRVQNDMDEFRRKRYGKMRCTVRSQNNLSENTRRILRDVFGSVEPV